MTNTNLTTKIDWTAKKIASLPIVQMVSKLPYEVNLTLSLEDTHYTVESYEMGERSSVKACETSELPYYAHVVVIHNHPFSVKQSKPSMNDIYFTQWVKRECEKKHSTLIDSIIVIQTGEFFSFKENNIL